MTVTDTLAMTNLEAASTEAGGAAEKAAMRKYNKYTGLSTTYTFIPIAFETLGPVNISGMELIDDLGRSMSSSSCDSRETMFLWQRLSVALQRFNAICFNGSFPSSVDMCDNPP